MGRQAPRQRQAFAGTAAVRPQINAWRWIEEGEYNGGAARSPRVAGRGRCVRAAPARSWAPTDGWGGAHIRLVFSAPLCSPICLEPKRGARTRKGKRFAIPNFFCKALGFEQSGREWSVGGCFSKQSLFPLFFLADRLVFSAALCSRLETSLGAL